MCEYSFIVTHGVGDVTLFYDRIRIFLIRIFDHRLGFVDSIDIVPQLLQGIDYGTASATNVQKTTFVGGRLGCPNDLLYFVGASSLGVVEHVIDFRVERIVDLVVVFH